MAHAVVEAVEQLDELRLGFLAAAPAAAGEQPGALHGGEELLVAEFLQQPTQELAQPAHVTAQGEVLGLEEDAAFRGRVEGGFGVAHGRT